MNAVHQDLLAYQAAMDLKEKKAAELAASGKRQYEYDSDEDTEVRNFTVLVIEIVKR